MNDIPDRLPTYAINEWKSCDLPTHPLDARDRRLVASLGGNGPKARLAVDELKAGLRVTARSWVGVVRFSSFEIRIEPKLTGGNAGLVRLIDYASGLDSLDRYPAVRTFEEGGGSLLDLIALLLAESCEGIVRAGLRADYRQVENDLPVVRGRLLADRQVLRRPGRIDRLECRFDEHTTDTVDNQLLLAALYSCANRVRHPGASLRIRRLVTIFGEACSLDELDLRATRATLTYDRMNGHYREAHGLAWLVLRGLGINDLLERGGSRCFAFLIDMNRLFELFITRWLTRLLRDHGYRVDAQRRDTTVVWDATLGRPYSHVRPDLMVEKNGQAGRYLPVDAKYKLYDDQGIPPSDVYQSFLYAFAYGQSTRYPIPSALLLYPTSTATPKRTHLHVRQSGGPAGAELLAIGVHVPTALAEAERGSLEEAGGVVLQSVTSRFPSDVSIE